MDSLVIKLEQEADFDKIISTSDSPVMVDFYADWCGPCLKLAPELTKRAESTKKFRVLKVNVDDFTDISEKYNVGGIPYVVLFKGGKQISYFVGYDLQSLDNMISSL